MNRLSIQERAKILGCLVEGMSVRASCRITGAAKKTVLRLIGEFGAACAEYHDKHVRNISSQRIQCDEIWSFCYAKKKNVPQELQGVYGYGDVYTWTALDADTKLMVSWLVANRNVKAANKFIHDLRDRLVGRIQLTTDGYKIYLNAIENVFAGDIDYAQLVKVYGDGEAATEKKYSPSEFVCADKTKVTGNPDQAHISTSFVERSNLSMRMSMRRFTRLTNAFSKKIANHEHAIAIYFMYYNFGRIHQTLRVTPAMEAGITDHVWSLEEIVGLAEPVKMAA